MKYAASLLITMGFLGMGLFVPMLFDMEPGHSGGCVASVIDGTACPTSMADVATHHMSAIQMLVTAIPANSGFLLLLASLLLISISIFLVYKNLLFRKPELLPQRLRDLTLQYLFNRQKATSWLSLFELSPAL